MNVASVDAMDIERTRERVRGRGGGEGLNIWTDSKIPSISLLVLGRAIFDVLCHGDMLHAAEEVC